MGVSLRERIAPMIDQLVENIINVARDVARDQLLDMVASIEVCATRMIEAPATTKTPIVQGRPVDHHRVIPRVPNVPADAHKRTSDGKMLPTCKKCGFYGGNARGCGRSHPTQAKPKAAASDGDDDGEEEGRRDLQGVERLAVIADRGDQGYGRGAAAPPAAARRDDVARAVRRDQAPTRQSGPQRAKIERAQAIQASADRPVARCVGADASTVSLYLGAPQLSRRAGPPAEITIFCYPPTQRARCRTRPARTEPRAVTTSIKRMTREFLALESADVAPFVASPAYEELIELRPRTREDCRGGQRPCPWVSCKHHLYLDVDPRIGSIKVNFPDLEPWEMEHTCALDVADFGGQTLEEVGRLANITRERARQVEVKGLLALKPAASQLGYDGEDDAHPTDPMDLLDGGY